jgi:hypothetical protein
VHWVMTILTDRNKPFDRFFSNVSFCISLMVNLCRTGTTIHATPIISLEYYITLPFPFIRLEIYVSVIISTLFAFYIESPTLKCKYAYYKNQ